MRFAGSPRKDHIVRRNVEKQRVLIDHRLIGRTVWRTKRDYTFWEARACGRWERSLTGWCNLNVRFATSIRGCPLEKEYLSLLRDYRFPRGIQTRDTQRSRRQNFLKLKFFYYAKRRKQFKPYQIRGPRRLAEWRFQNRSTIVSPPFMCSAGKSLRKGFVYWSRILNT